MRIYEVDLSVLPTGEFSLWYGDPEEAGIDRIWVAESDGGEIAGFLSANIDGLCVAIEVLVLYQGQGIGRALVQASGCWKPEEDYNPEFWEKMAEEFGYGY